jgi:hypothetical protein
MRERETDHKLVKTTPKPNATKNNKGELVGPLVPPPLPVVLADGGPEVVAEEVCEVEASVEETAVVA